MPKKAEQKDKLKTYYFVFTIFEDKGAWHERELLGATGKPVLFKMRKIAEKVKEHVLLRSLFPCNVCIGKREIPGNLEGKSTVHSPYQFHVLGLNSWSHTRNYAIDVATALPQTYMETSDAKQ